MSSAIALKQDFDVSRLVVNGDLSQLSPEQKSQYYIHRCKEHGLSPSSQPFNYLQLNGKLVLYANKGCAEQLRGINKVSIKVTKADQVGDIFVVIAEAKDGNGREDSATGAVSIVGLKGEALANAMMKAETKAKRRVTLSICGINMLDETEVESIQLEKGPKPITDEPSLSHDDSGYRIPFGKYVNRSLEEVGPRDLGAYVNYLEKKAAEKGEIIQGRVGDFIQRASEYIAAFENEETQQ